MLNDCFIVTGYSVQETAFCRDTHVKEKSYCWNRQLFNRFGQYMYLKKRVILLQVKLDHKNEKAKLQGQLEILQVSFCLYDIHFMTYRYLNGVKKVQYSVVQYKVTCLVWISDL